MTKDYRAISENIEYCIETFYHFGIILTEEKNFKMDCGDLAIYLTHNGNDLIVRKVTHIIFNVRGTIYSKSHHLLVRSINQNYFKIVLTS